MKLDRAIEHAIDGDSVLFIGAGFSIGALNQNGEPLKTGGQLARHLAAELNITYSIDLEDVSEEYREKFGDDRLIELLKTEFTVSRVTDSQRIISQLPWRRIYTTNYDNVIETAYSSGNSTITSVSLTDNIRHTPRISMCVHLNGCISRLDRESIYDEIKLTDTSYLTSNVANSDWANLFRQDLSMARSIFFVGYSLADLDIRRILFEQDILQSKAFFIIGKSPDQNMIRKVNRFGTICKGMDSNAFGDLISQKSKVYLRPDNIDLVWYCFEATKPDGKLVPKFSDNDFLSLLSYGHFNRNLIATSLYQDTSYYCKRSKIEQVLDILANKSPYVVVTAELGNGKTLFLEGLKFRAIEQGYDVFSLINRSEYIYDELDQIGKLASKGLVIVENYHDWFDVVDHIGMCNFPNLKFVFSARTSVHDLTFDTLSKGLETDNVAEIPIDYLDENEIEWIVRIFDEYGLWSYQAGWSARRKKEHIVFKCHSQFHAILLMVIEAPQILDRLTLLIENLQVKNQYFKIIVSILVLSVLGRTNKNLTILTDLWGTSIYDTTFRRDSLVRELIDFDTNDIRMRSSVTARYILTKIADTNTIIDTLIEMIRAMNSLRNINKQYESLRIELMRFSQIQNILPEKGRLAAVVKYYESIKAFVEVRENPLFWLQFAVACVTLHDFDRAESLFGTAYALATKRGRATNQIDNHYARYLLERSIEKNDVILGITDFRKARKILHSQMAIERRHYPYRVAILYKEFYENFQDELSDKYIIEIEKAARHVLRQVDKSGLLRGENRHVRQCKDEMEYLIILIDESNHDKPDSSVDKDVSNSEG